MPYISQNRGDVRCGAYAAAYWIWEKVGLQPGVNAENVVRNIYDTVKFNSTDMQIINKFDSLLAKKMSGYSNPFKISDYINDVLEIRTSIISANENFRHMLNMLDPNRNMTAPKKIQDLDDGESAILIMGKYLGGQPDPQHYVYAVGNDAIQLPNNRIGMTVIDPADGNETPVHDNLSEWTASFHGMQFLNTVIR